MPKKNEKNDNETLEKRPKPTKTNQDEDEPVVTPNYRKVPGDPESIRCQVVTAVFWVLALLSAVFFIANIWEDAGPLIEGFCMLMYGLFGYGGLLIVCFFVLMAVEWKNYVVKRDAACRIPFALLFILLTSTLFHIIMIINGALPKPTFPSSLNPLQYWYTDRTVVGGGMLGGFFGSIFYFLMHGWVSILACVILMIADLMLYFRLTPLRLARSVAAYVAKAKEQALAKDDEEDDRRLAKQKKDAKKRAREEERLARDAERRLLAEAEAKRREELAQQREEEARRKKEEEAKRREEEEAERRRRDPRIDFDFLTDPQDEEALDEAASDKSFSEEEENDDPPLPPITVYTAPSDADKAADEDEAEEKEEEDFSYDFNHIPDGEDKGLDAIENTDFGFGNDEAEFDLSAFLASDKEQDGEKPSEDEPADGEAVDELPDDVSDEASDGASDGLLEDDLAVPAEPAKPAYIYPPVTLLSPNQNLKSDDCREELARNARKLVEVLKSFRVDTEIVNISRGPTITRYELAPKIGVRVRAIANLVDDIALNLETSGVRIEAPIPGKAAVGVEVPNKTAEIVYLRDIIESDAFQHAKSKLTACVGMDVSGAPIVMDIAKLPHMLIAGATGMGKSIAVNCIIMSLLYKTTPDELKLILVDPKKVEFKPYDKLPHLLIPVVTNPKKAAGALATAVNEMERRFELIEMAGVRDIKGYNKMAENDPTKEKLPSIVIIIDELADLMMTAKDDVEDSICRIAQKARAAGIHLIICTQRPSVDVITGLIKANVPSRIALTVASNIDSRTIIDVAGAEKLIGRGDMLFAPVGAMKPMRVQGAFVSDAEVEAVTSFIRNQFQDVHYDDSFINQLEIEAERCGQQKKKAGSDEIDADDELDPKFYEAVEIAVEMGKISTSLLQRRLSLGYGRAAKIIDKMEQMGVVGPQEGQKPRNILISRQEYQEMMMRRDDPAS